MWLLGTLTQHFVLGFYQKSLRDESAADERCRLRSGDARASQVRFWPSDARLPLERRRNTKSQLPLRNNCMQRRHANPPIRLTGRHVTVTDAMKEYVRRKVACLHLDYPRIVDVHAILERWQPGSALCQTYVSAAPIPFRGPYVTK